VYKSQCSCGLASGGKRSTAVSRLKPAVLRPLALRDQQGQVRHDRKEGGTRVAVTLATTSNAALDQIEIDPGIGSPMLGTLPGIAGLRTWRVTKFPLLWCHFERGDHLDVIRLPGERQEIAAILGDEFASD
jgi:toxin ParE1/3/4